MLNRNVALFFWLSAFFFIFNLNKFHCKKQYFSMHHPKFITVDHEYFTNEDFVYGRISRTDPLYYGNMSFYLLKPLNNTAMSNIYVHQLLSNVYKPSFVNLHYRFCDSFKLDTLMGVYVTPAFYRLPASQRTVNLTCPLTPGQYHFVNLQFPSTHIPKNFPFEEGRIFYNVTLKKKILASLRIDLKLISL